MDVNRCDVDKALCLTGHSQTEKNKCGKKANLIPTQTQHTAYQYH